MLINGPEKLYLLPDAPKLLGYEPMTSLSFQPSLQRVTQSLVSTDEYPYQVRTSPQSAFITSYGIHEAPNSPVYLHQQMLPSQSSQYVCY